MKDLRPYQHHAISSVCSDLDTKRSTLLVLPTGGGKTVCFAKIAERFAPSGRILVLAHREELIRQAVTKIQEWTALRCGVEMAGETSGIDGLYPPDVVVASVQSLSRAKRLSRFAEFDFSLIIVDEAHHGTSTTYRDILNYFSSAKLVGVTATPDRGDREALGQVFESVAFTYEMREAIADGYLAPIVQKSVQVQGLDLSKVRTTRGDLNEKEMSELLRKDEHLHHIAEPIIDLAGERKTLIFAVDVAHAHELARGINGAFGEKVRIAEALDGSALPKIRDQVIKRFISGETRYLVNCALFTEGFDLPAISCVAVARPTKSRSLYAQMVGRGTRLSPETGKTNCLVLDFKGNAGKHQLVCPVDILGGKVSEKVRERAEKLLAGRADLSISDAVDTAEKQLEDEAKSAAEKKAIAVATRKRVREIDPFAVLGGQPRSSGGGAPSEAQIATLKSLGFPAEKQVWKLDAAGARELIETLAKRRRDGLCSFAQMKLLKGYGLNGDVSFQEAKKTIDTIAANGWRVPEQLRALAG